MSFPAVPNWIRIVLLILSFLSFVPQIRRTISRKSSSGISVYYTLLNLICATEQFALVFMFTVNNIGDPDIFAHLPINTGDWLNLAQTGVVALLWLLLFALCVAFPSDHRDAPRWFALLIYAVFLSISLLPLYLDIINPSYPNDRRWFGAIYHALHTLFLSWIISFFGIAAPFFQANEALSRPPKQFALSRVGLAAQVCVFTLVAVSWVMRVNFPWEKIGDHRIGVGFLQTWFELVGWAVVDNAVFALGQAVLLGVVLRHAGKGSEESEGETEPLLRA